MDEETEVATEVEKNYSLACVIRAETGDTAMVMNFEGPGSLAWSGETYAAESLTMQNTADEWKPEEDAADEDASDEDAADDYGSEDAGDDDMFGRRLKGKKVRKGKGKNAGNKGLKWRRRQKRRFRKQATKLTMKKATLDAEAKAKASKELALANGKVEKKEWVKA